MDCTEVNKLLSTFYDGELSSDKWSAVEEHLKGCPDCARELEGFRTLSALAEGLIHPEPPPKAPSASRNWPFHTAPLPSCSGQDTHRLATLPSPEHYEGTAPDCRAAVGYVDK